MFMHTSKARTLRQWGMSESVGIITDRTPDQHRPWLNTTRHGLEGRRQELAGNAEKQFENLHPWFRDLAARCWVRQRKSEELEHLGQLVLPFQSSCIAEITQLVSLRRLRLCTLRGQEARD